MRDIDTTGMSREEEGTKLKKVDTDGQRAQARRDWPVGIGYAMCHALIMSAQQTYPCGLVTYQ